MKNLIDDPIDKLESTLVLEKPNLKPTMNSSESSELANSAVNPITRRNFMKKSALTVGAVTLLGHGTGLAANCTSCTTHGTVGNPSACCTFVTEIKVVFKTASAVNGAPDYPDDEQARAKSGRRFFGTLTYKWYNCSDGQTRTEVCKVYSGGHREHNSHITAGHDTPCPAGNRWVTPNTVDPDDPNGDPLNGFPVKPDATTPVIRTAIQVHGPGINTGCIGFENYPDLPDSKGFSAFEPRLRGNNFPSVGAGAKPDSTGAKADGETEQKRISLKRARCVWC